MVEKLSEAVKQSKKDIPPFGKVKNISFACDWKSKYGYPTNDMLIADYYVEYEKLHMPDEGAFWLIEGCKSHLHNNLKQLESSAGFFKEKGIPVDSYLIVIDELTKTDKNRYHLKPSINKPLKELEERSGYQEKNPILFYKKPVFVIFRRDFGQLTK